MKLLHILSDKIETSLYVVLVVFSKSSGNYIVAPCTKFLFLEELASSDLHHRPGFDYLRILILTINHSRYYFIKKQ